MVNIDCKENEAEIETQIRHISQRLREERKKSKIFQMDLSFKAVLSQNQVNYIEAGERTPNLYTLLSICNAMKINPAVPFETEEAERKKARETIIQFVSRFM